MVKDVLRYNAIEAIQSQVKTLLLVLYDSVRIYIDLIIMFLNNHFPNANIFIIQQLYLFVLACQLAFFV